MLLCWLAVGGCDEARRCVVATGTPHGRSPHMTDRQIQRQANRHPLWREKTVGLEEGQEKHNQKKKSKREREHERHLRRVYTPAEDGLRHRKHLPGCHDGDGNGNVKVRGRDEYGSGGRHNAQKQRKEASGIRNQALDMRHEASGSTTGCGGEEGRGSGRSIL